MKKRGLSAVVTTLIIILLVLVAVGVVWVVIANLIKEGAEQVSLGKFTINMEIKNVEVKSDGTVEVKVKRNSGKGDLSGIKFLINDGVEVYEFEESTEMGELGQRTFTLNYNGLVKDVSIAPILESESGEEFVGNEIDNEKTGFIGIDVLEGYDLAYWWRFEGDANDEIGGNDGTISGADCNAQGKFGEGCEFDSSDYIRLSSDISLGGNIDWSLSAWVKMSGTNMYVLTNANGGPVTNALQISSSKIHYYHYEGPWKSEYGTSEMSSGEWHFLIWVNHDDETIDLYVDGIIETKGAPSRTSNSGPVNQIGRNWGSTTYPGLIDEVMIFDRVLNEDEVRRLYESER